MAPSKQKKLSLQKEEVVDRISDLPDCLLCHILSFLPTAQAVATSILSSRWKTLWTFVPCIDLDVYLVLRWNHCISYTDILSRVFAQHKALNLRKFHIFSGMSCNPSDVDRWVRTAISPSLEEFKLLFYNFIGRKFELPRSIFSCKNLVVLKLHGEILLNLHSSFKLPSLKILHLNITTYDDSHKRLLSCCPVLEDLAIEIIGLQRYNFKLEICVPTLKHLKIVLISTYFDNVLEINAPALEYVNFVGSLSEVVFLGKRPNLVEANISLESVEKVVGLLREFYNVKYLSLSYSTTKCLNFAYDYELPMFHNLARLNCKFSCCNWNVLRYLLLQAPSLEVLVVDKTFSMELPQNVPKVLSPHLKTVYLGFKRLKDLHLTTFYFRGFKGLKDELKFVRCIINKARVLKKMTFRYQGSYQNAEEEKSRILKKVSNFPRHSMSCQIAFE